MLKRFDDSDDTSKLRGIMENLNERWTRVNERYVIYIGSMRIML